MFFHVQKIMHKQTAHFLRLFVSADFAGLRGPSAHSQPHALRRILSGFPEAGFAFAQRLMPAFLAWLHNTRVANV